MPKHLFPTLLIVALAACAHAPNATAPTAPTAHILLLGEVHDSAAGHAARAEYLRGRIESGWRPAIAMEQFDTESQATLDAAMRTCKEADCVIAATAPAKASWTWAYYTPVIQLALDYHLPLIAANLSRAQAAKIVRGRFADALPDAVIAHYQLDTLPTDVLTAQEAEVRTSHCGALPEALVPAMANAQIARDVVMAQALRTHAANGVVLIAGNGHVRSDIAVAYWLRRDGLRPYTVGFLEPASDARVFDETHRIPATQRADPCASFKPPKLTQ